MSLYWEAAEYLREYDNEEGALATRVYSAKNLTNKGSHIYALICEATKWSTVLSEVVEKSDILQVERRLTPSLALLLSHDLLLAKDGVAAPKSHVLSLAIRRHKTRLNAEFTKVRIKAGFGSVDAWQTYINAKSSDELSVERVVDGVVRTLRQVRWIRINTLRTTLAKELGATFPAFDSTRSVSDIVHASGGRPLAVDSTIPNLVAIPRGVDLSKTEGYREGKIIFQDKASCFPAYLLDPRPEDGDIIDACAAPGNKTTHLAALLADARHTGAASTENHSAPTIYACERDVGRSATLQKLVRVAGADENKRVECLVGQNFLDLDPKDKRWENVGALLLDPSCSGSGIIGRDDGDARPTTKLRLPRPSWQIRIDNSSASNERGRKRKRTTSEAPAIVEAAKISPTKDRPTSDDDDDDDDDQDQDPTQALLSRLTALSAFQLKLLLHAFAFPAARKVIYSTCSIHAEENEHVVMRALLSPVSKQRGWRVLRREEQVKGIKEWKIRGSGDAIEAFKSGGSGSGGETTETGVLDAEEVREACLRCEKWTEEGTQGFFVVGFVRDVDPPKLVDGANSNLVTGPEVVAETETETETGEDEEWGGFGEG